VPVCETAAAGTAAPSVRYAALVARSRRRHLDVLRAEEGLLADREPGVGREALVVGDPERHPGVPVVVDLDLGDGADGHVVELDVGVRDEVLDLVEGDGDRVAVVTDRLLARERVGVGLQVAAGACTEHEERAERGPGCTPRHSTPPRGLSRLLTSWSAPGTGHLRHRVSLPHPTGIARRPSRGRAG
jgi:hypothetical protein